MMSIKPHACVIGDMDLVRPLGLAGVRCAVSAPEGDPTWYSRFTCARVPWVDSWRDPEGMVASLLAFGERQPMPPVLFYEEDRDVLLISRNRERLSPVFRFVVPDT